MMSRRCAKSLMACLLAWQLTELTNHSGRMSSTMPLSSISSSKANKSACEDLACRCKFSMTN